MTDIPSGFERFATESPFIAMVGPYYVCREAERLIFGLRVLDQHCNSSGRLHGGMVGSLADIAIGHNIGLADHNQITVAQTTTGIPGTPMRSMTTVSLSTDYVGSASKGDWVEVHVDVQRSGGSLAFANAYLVCDSKRIARVSAVFKLFR